MFRAAVANSSELGKAVQVYLQRGSLVPNSTTEKVVQHSLEKGKQVENP
jgi:adenylate kinase family enzyme